MKFRSAVFQLFQAHRTSDKLGECHQRSGVFRTFENVFTVIYVHLLQKEKTHTQTYNKQSLSVHKNYEVNFGYSCIKMANDKYSKTFIYIF
jgi:hypothetical protein